MDAPMGSERVPRIEVRELTKMFGGLRAVSAFDETIYPGELVGLIGPNGAGKTTVFNMVTGLYAQTSGRMLAIVCMKEEAD